MKVIALFQNAFHSIFHWLDRHFGSDRLTTLPRKKPITNEEKNSLNYLRKLYIFSTKTNIAITGEKTCGKKGFVEKFEMNRWFRVGKFLHINVPVFMGDYGSHPNMQIAFDEFIERYLLSHAHAGELPGETDRLVRGSVWLLKKPLYALLISFFAYFFLSKIEQWIDPLINILQIDLFLRTYQISWGIEEIKVILSLFCALIILLCWIIIINSLVKHWSSKYNSKLSANSRFIGVEASLESTPKRQDCNQTIIYLLYKMRWQIGHTVVFENLEEFGEESFCSMISHLCDLNERINKHSTTWKFWNVARLKRPIRFLYIYRNDVIQLKRDKFIFDDTILIAPLVRPSIVFHKLKEMLELEVSKGAGIPMNKLFPFEAEYEIQVSKYLINMRTLNKIARNYIDKYETFSRCKNVTPWEIDASKLFSFVLFDHFFSKECASFASQTLIDFSKETRRIDPEDRELFEYLISSSCSEKYRIDYICKRYVGYLDFQENYMIRYQQALSVNDYVTALAFIEEAICCKPEDEELRKTREELLLRRKSEIVSG